MQFGKLQSCIQDIINQQKMKQTKHSSMKEQIRYRLSKTNHYDLLDLQKQCTAEDIKRSYKKMALRFHPDKNTNDGAKQVFNKITNAYSQLSNSDKKAEYDEKIQKKQPNFNSSPNQRFNFSSRDQFGYDPFRNQQRFRNFGSYFYQAQKQKQEDQKKRRQQQRQYEQMEKQFDRMFKKLFKSFGEAKNERWKGESQKQQTFQRNQERQNLQKMKRQYQEQQKAQQVKARQKKEQIKRKNLLLFFIFLFLSIFLGPDLFHSLTSKPIYSPTKNNIHRYQRKTSHFGSSFYVSQKFFGVDVTEEVIKKIEEIIDKRYLSNLKKECAISESEKRKLQMKGLSEKIGVTREYYLQKSRKISTVSCKILLDLAESNRKYFILINK